MLRALTLAGLVAAVVAPAASGYTALSLPHGAITDGPSTPDRLLRPGGSGVSTCATPSAYPGSVGSGPYGVTSFFLQNAGNTDVCVTRTLTANSAQCQGAGIEAGSFKPGTFSVDTATWPAAFLGDPRNSAGGSGSTSNTVSWATKVGAGSSVFDILWDVSNATHCDDFAYTLDTDRLWPLSHPDLAHADGPGQIGAGTSVWPGAAPSVGVSWSRCPIGAGPCQPFGGTGMTQAVGSTEVGQKVVARHSAVMLGALPNSVDTTRSATISSLAPVVHATTSSTGGATYEPGADLVDGSDCDECNKPITPPFPLQLQGRSYDTAQAGSNGVILLGADAEGGGYRTSCFANPTSSPMVAPLWQDLEASEPGDGIYTATAGTAPHRRYIVEWRSRLYNTTTPERFEAIFHEDSPVISFVYGDNDGGGDAVIGAQTAQVLPFAVSASCNTGTPTPAGTQIDLVPHVPAISGTPRVGDALTATNGDWDSLSGSPAFAGQWLRCDADGAACTAIDGATAATYTPSAGDLGARLAYQVTATDALGAQPARSAPTAAVVAQPVPPDTTAPSFTSFALSAKRFRVGKAQTPVVARKVRKGTMLSYGLSEQATVTFTVKQVRKGRRKGKRCVPGRKTGKRCTVRTTRGTLTRTAPAGASKLAFSGRIGKRALKPGSYVLVAVARDASGNVSAAKSVAFKIVR
jgi:hypothetical protein